MTGRSKLVRALPRGVAPQQDVERVGVLGMMHGYDDESRTALVSIDGGDQAWVPVIADVDWAQVVGEPVHVLRNAWTGRVVWCVAPTRHVEWPAAAADVLPVRGTVTSVPGAGRVVVSAGGETYTARTILSYASPAVGDVVALDWASDGSEVVAVGEIGSWAATAPATPPAPTLSRSSSTVTVSWPKPAGVDTTRVRRRHVGVSAWTTTAGLTGTSMTFSMARGKRVEVQIAQSNAGGQSGWSAPSEITYPAAPTPSKPSAPKYETRTVTLTPTFTGTYRLSVNRWDDWNRGRFGFPRTLYQGSKYGSGPMRGLATYGTKVRDLRATEILWIEVLIKRHPLGERTHPPLRVSSSANGSRPSGAPDQTGSFVQVNPGRTGSDWARLPASGLEGWRTGSLRGVVTDAGAGYGAMYGLGSGGMQLRVRYRRRV